MSRTLPLEEWREERRKREEGGVAEREERQREKGKEGDSERRGRGRERELLDLVFFRKSFSQTDRQTTHPKIRHELLVQCLLQEVRADLQHGTLHKHTHTHTWH